MMKTLNREEPNYRPALDAASAFCFHSEGYLRRASEARRWRQQRAFRRADTYI